MTDSPPPEAQRFASSQTPESPRPVHIPEPSNIPVLFNQMDPVFNDTATYNIPHNQTFSPYSDSTRAANDPNNDEQDAVQSFLRGAEEENSRLNSITTLPQATDTAFQNDSVESNLVQAPASSSTRPDHEASASFQSVHDQVQSTHQPEVNSSSMNENENNPTANGHDALASLVENLTQPSSLAQSAPQPDQGGIDYQSLLDTISQSASTAPAAEPVSAPTTASSNDQTAHALPSVPGLPPKPPALENGVEPQYAVQSPTVADRIAGQAAYQPPQAAEVTESPLFDVNQVHIPNYLAQAPGQTLPQQSPGAVPSNNLLQRPEPSRSTDPLERKMSPESQSKYDQFLEDERRYVTEGIWDKFPNGSRLFVGNLPSEKVTKRDLFFTFHHYGRLAQISIKQAYGFVQYLEAASCSAALAAEQGVEIRGRKVHLEISKPQKNTRNQNQGNKRRRSRSPDRANPRQNERFGRNSFDNYRDDRSGRGEHRRSPSPRSYRSRDDHRGSAQSPRFGSARPRSPYGGGFPSHVPPAYDDEASLPIPRRDPRDVPDVQLLILEASVAQGFINWIEQGFRSKGLKASTMWLSPRLPLNAVVKRQIIEGVQAIVKLSQAAQYNSKIPLQVFDRSAGQSNVNFNEYADLDVPVAADIVLHARQKDRGAAPAAFPHQPYGQPQHPPSPYGHYPQAQYPSQPSQPPQPPQPPQNYPQYSNNYQAYSQQPTYQNQGQTPVTPNSAAPNLQQLLANLRQPGDHQKIPGGHERPPADLAGILNNAARQPGPQYGMGQPPHQQQHNFNGNPSAYGGNTSQPQQNVQNIMETLARYNR
ncbi:hypothetical protein PV10_00467 [Exophiala mesophila]|uniref:RRM domain-containing protein n=1 Tax=Exophiala mesophila TaxID=212818 RepID=A0A0D2ACF3_EXOME|nr:uncharacterized protein PV10_00467 [Exophiala mesophila]KIV96628.1 hypothetical protein PV10_00467 [Exophiala mesophila]